VAQSLLPSKKDHEKPLIGDPFAEGLEPLPSKLTSAPVAAGFGEIMNDAAASAAGLSSRKQQR
jgi:hypothetical protein